MSYRFAGWDDSFLGVWSPPMQVARLPPTEDLPFAAWPATLARAFQQEERRPQPVSAAEAKAGRVAAKLLRQADLPDTCFEELRDILLESGNPRLVARRLRALFSDDEASLTEIGVIHAVRTSWRPFETEYPSPVVSWRQGLKLVRAYGACPDADELMDTLTSITEAWVEAGGGVGQQRSTRELMWFVDEVLTRGTDELDPTLSAQARLDTWVVGPIRDDRTHSARHRLRDRHEISVPAVLRPEWH